MVWSHAVGPEGKVTGLEFSPEYAREAEEAFKANGVENVEVIVGDGLETCVPLVLPTTLLPPGDLPRNPQLTATETQPPQAQPRRALRPHLPRRPKVRLPDLPRPHPRAVHPR